MALNNGIISGKVFGDSNADGIYDPSEPVGTARTVVLLKDGIQIAQTTSDANGFYQFNNLEAGTYEISRSFPPGYQLSNPTVPNGKTIVVTLNVTQAIANIGSKEIPKSSSSSAPVVPTPPVNKPTESSSSVQISSSSSIEVSSSSSAIVNPVPPSSILWGVCDLRSNAVLGASSTIKELNPKVNRVWFSPNGFVSFTKLGSSVIDAIKVYGLTGAIPIICVSDQPTQVKGDILKWFIAFIEAIITECNKDPKTKNMPIWIECGNEPDLEPDHYWIGDIISYVNQYLKPIYQPLKTKYQDRVQLCSAGFSWNSDLLISNMPLIAQYCDAIGFHGYLTTLSLLHRYSDVKKAAIKVNKPVWLTELALGYGKLIKNEPDPTKKAGLQTAWYKDTPKLIQYIKATQIEVVAYYETINLNHTTNAGASLLTETTFAKTPFFDAYVKNQ